MHRSKPWLQPEFGGKPMTEESTLDEVLTPAAQLIQVVIDDIRDAQVVAEVICS